MATPSMVDINGSEVERVNEYKYSRVVMDDKLKWTSYVKYVEGRPKPTLYCLRKLNSFQIHSRILSLFYNSIILSVWTYCWAGNCYKTNKNMIGSVVRRASRIVG